MPNIITVTTESGSIYEIDTAKRRVRRASGSGPATARMGGDQANWRPYAELAPERPVIGRPLTIIWGDDVELLPESKAQLAAGTCGIYTPMTQTSRICKVN